MAASKDRWPGLDSSHSCDGYKEHLGSSRSTCEKRVLIADANPLCADTLVLGLRRFGYQVTAVSDGWSACRELFEGHFQAVVLELDLPKMDGITMLKTLRRSDPHTHIVLISGSATVIEVSQAKECGANEFLAKPFSMQQLQARLDRVNFEEIGARKLQETKRRMRARANLNVWHKRLRFYLRSSRFRRSLIFAALTLAVSAFVGFFIVMSWQENSGRKGDDVYIQKMEELIEAVRQDWGR